MRNALQILPNANKTTMSSTEIAELTGKEKTNIHRDIKAQLLVGLYGLKDDSYLNDNKIQGITIVIDNRDYWSEVLLDKYHTDILISGYEVKYRAAIVKRWHELEQRNHIVMPNFSDPAAAAIAWAEQYTLAQNAIATKAEIGNRREATAMNTASQAVKQVKKLEVELDRSKDYCTIKRMEMLYHGQKFNWRLLKSASAELGIEPQDVFDANYGTVKAYHVDAWQEAYAISHLEAA
jgi:phage regulator Rha-like protein